MTLDEILDGLAREIAARLPQAHAATGLPALWGIRDVCEQTGLGKEKVYELLRSGDIKGMRVDPGKPGSRWLVLPESVIEWRDRELAMQNGDSSKPFAQKRTSRGRA